MSGLRHFVAAPYRPFCVAMYAGKSETVLPAIRAAYQQKPDDWDIYLIRSQADPAFRRAEWKLRRDKKSKTADDRFKRGVTLLYCYFEWRTQMAGDDLRPLLTAAATELEAVWREKHSLISGAALAATLGESDYQRSLTFNEEFLRFVDPDNSYKAYLQAKSRNFSGVPLVLNNVPDDKKDIAATILGGRWSLLVSGAPGRKPSQEALVLEKWWRDLAKRAPPI